LIYQFIITPSQLKNDKTIIKLWGKEYDTIANFFMDENKLDFMFSDKFLIPLIGKSNDEISKIIFNNLDS